MGCVQSTPNVKESAPASGGTPKLGKQSAPTDTCAVQVQVEPAAPKPDAVQATNDKSTVPGAPGQEVVQVTCAKSTVAASADKASTTSKSMDVVVWRRPDPAPDEDERWDMLCKLHILDTEPEAAYDRITTLCAQVFKTPMSCVTFLDRERVWFKSLVGLPCNELKRDRAFCSWTALSRYPETLVVPDLRDDARFSRYPLVTDWPNIRCYVSCPLVAGNGIRMGTLCVLDTVPRYFSESDVQLLAQLATLVVKEVEHRAALNAAMSLAAGPGSLRPHTGPDCLPADGPGVMLIDASDPKWPILFVSQNWDSHMAVSDGDNFWDLFLPLSGRQVQAYTLATEQGRPFQLRVCRATHSSSAANSSAINSGIGNSSASNSAAANSAGWVEAGSPVAAASGSHGECVLMQFWSMKASGGGPFDDAAAIAIPALFSDKLVPPTAAGRYYWASVVPSATEWGSLQCSRRSSATGNISAPETPSLTHTRTSAQHSSASSYREHEPPGSDDEGSYVGGLVVQEVPPTPFVLLPEATDPFSNVQLGSVLGRGSYGTVYRGLWNDTLVAVKVVDIAMRNQNPHAALEALLHNKLSHPNIVKLYGISTRETFMKTSARSSKFARQQSSQEVWMILEFCDRGTLADAIARGALCERGPDGTRLYGVVSIRRLLSTMREVASAMAYLHEQNVLHGDLTGNNILLATDSSQRKGFKALVGDFGLSRLIGTEDSRITTPTIGTITHMAPEVVLSTTHSRAADVYSFGMLLLEGYLGENPYRGMHYAQVVQHVSSGKPVPVPEDMPGDLKALLLAALSRDPQQRPSFAEIHERLQQMEAQCKPAGGSTSPSSLAGIVAPGS